MTIATTSGLFDCWTPGCEGVVKGPRQLCQKCKNKRDGLPIRESIAERSPSLKRAKKSIS